MVVNNSTWLVVRSVDLTGGNYRLMYSKSIDAGLTWSEGIIQDSDIPIQGVAFSGSTCIVVATPARVYNSLTIYDLVIWRSVDGLENWSNKIYINQDNSFSDYGARIATDGSTWLIVNAEIYGRRDICLTRSIDEGATWSARRLIHQNNVAWPYPEVATNGATWLIVWSGGSPGTTRSTWSRHTKGTFKYTLEAS